MKVIRKVSLKDISNRRQSVNRTRMMDLPSHSACSASSSDTLTDVPLTNNQSALVDSKRNEPREPEKHQQSIEGKDSPFVEVAAVGSTVIVRVAERRIEDQVG